jgi:hypothetical protein
LCDFLSDKYVGQEWVKREDVLKDIEECPAADAQEVVHGKWEDVPIDFGCGDIYGMNKYNRRIKCSNCRFVTSSELRYHICPNCGAKMDKE